MTTNRARFLTPHPEMLQCPLFKILIYSIPFSWISFKFNLIPKLKTLPHRIIGVWFYQVLHIINSEHISCMLKKKKSHLLFKIALLKPGMIFEAIRSSKRNTFFRNFDSNKTWKKPRESAVTLHPDNIRSILLHHADFSNKHISTPKRKCSKFQGNEGNIFQMIHHENYLPAL